MINLKHTQSVSDFKANYAKTLDRLNRTGKAEILTQNGQAKAVLLSPGAFEQLMDDAQLTRDIAMIRNSHEQYRQGNTRPVHAVFDDLKRKLLSMKKSS